MDYTNLIKGLEKNLGIKILKIDFPVFIEYNGKLVHPCKTHEHPNCVIHTCKTISLGMFCSESYLDLAVRIGEENTQIEFFSIILQEFFNGKLPKTIYLLEFKIGATIFNDTDLKPYNEIKINGYWNDI